VVGRKLKFLAKLFQFGVTPEKRFQVRPKMRFFTIKHVIISQQAAYRLIRRYCDFLDPVITLILVKYRPRAAGKKIVVTLGNPNRKVALVVRQNG
jgi:hypothetical protein